MADKVTISKQLYVGFRMKETFDKKEFPLAFATPFDKEDAAFKKRKETVDCWSYGYSYKYKDKKDPNEGSTSYIDNVPLKDFAIDSVTRRYETNNKLFDIRDPRGFTLQISAENLFELLQHGTIIKGVLEGEHIWGRKGGSNILIPTDSELYKNANPKIVKLKSEEYKEGDIVTTTNSGNYVYLGEKWVLPLVDPYEKVWTGYGSRTTYVRSAEVKNLTLKPVKMKLFLDYHSHRDMKDRTRFYNVVKDKMVTGTDGRYADYKALLPENGKLIPYTGTSLKTGVAGFKNEISAFYDTEEQANDKTNLVHTFVSMLPDRFESQKYLYSGGALKELWSYFYQNGNLTIGEKGI